MQIPLRQNTTFIASKRQNNIKVSFQMFLCRIYNPERTRQKYLRKRYLTLQKIINMSTKILIIGACGQIGTELTHSLRKYTELIMLSLLIFEN
jgi:hypothetical protein